MRSRISRHLGPAFAETSSARRDDLAASLAARAAAAEIEVPPPEFTGRDYLIFLLYVAAEIEHSLMVQYLFTALGAPLNFNREDYPHGSAFYPFGFTLAPASLGSLAT